MTPASSAPTPAASAASVSSPDNSKRTWCSTFSLSGRICFVSIVFAFMLTAALLFAPSCAFASSEDGACGAYVFALSGITDFMFWALAFVLIENLCVDVFAAFLDVKAMRHNESLNAFMFSKLLDALKDARSGSTTSASAAPETSAPAAPETSAPAAPETSAPAAATAASDVLDETKESFSSVADENLSEASTSEVE